MEKPDGGEVGFDGGCRMAAFLEKSCVRINALGRDIGKALDLGGQVLVNGRGLHHFTSCTSGDRRS